MAKTTRRHTQIGGSRRGPVDVADLTVEQCRALARIQARRPDALVTLHPSSNGVVVEVRLGRRVALARLTPSGSLQPDKRLKLAG